MTSRALFGFGASIFFTIVSCYLEAHTTNVGFLGAHPNPLSAPSLLPLALMVSRCGCFLSLEHDGARGRTEPHRKPIYFDSTEWGTRYVGSFDSGVSKLRAVAMRRRKLCILFTTMATSCALGVVVRKGGGQMRVSEWVLKKLSIGHECKFVPVDKVAIALFATSPRQSSLVTLQLTSSCVARMHIWLAFYGLFRCSALLTCWSCAC